MTQKTKVLFIVTVLLVGCATEPEAAPSKYTIGLTDGTTKIIIAQECRATHLGEWGQGRAPMTIVRCGKRLSYTSAEVIFEGQALFFQKDAAE